MIFNHVLSQSSCCRFDDAIAEAGCGRPGLRRNLQSLVFCRSIRGYIYKFLEQWGLLPPRPAAKAWITRQQL